MLTVRDLAISYATRNDKVLQNVTFHLEPGQIGCILGPSGCGKTTLLRAIAGFIQPLAGEIELDGKVVSSSNAMLPPNQRNIGMVFQDFALFPHMTVAENIAFGLRAMNHSESAARVDELLALVELSTYKDVYPHALSGGQQQRVALARALAPKPKLVLLDEPFSNLDSALREQLAQDVRGMLKAAGATAIMVTHDQHEAFAMADQVAVLQDAKMQQVGTPYELYHQPQTTFVAGFIGEGVMLEAKLNASGRLETVIGDFDAEHATYCDGAQAAKGQTLQLLVRPDDIVHDDSSRFKAIVVNRHFRGASILYYLTISESDDDQCHPLLCLAPSHHDHQVGESFGIRLDMDHLILFPQ
ncbi:ABC transporter ATP-binding protein [Alteromonas sp. ASW11-36]|uniref:ABC transporter ATP-binding protein n=1 Tax=Alteromonas arenosi TaxID=3055817 RepID=A0ABT7SUU5_9ALTE|nr:ABC transporter ATP-binding protein [Alteromonas sp. ASW11-36]MDM7859960.1 ABC transporter ATP-binding protein [Alteromonas sp. ASW11-36]